MTRVRLLNFSTRAFGSSHGLPSQTCWEDTLQKVPDFVGSKERKRVRIHFKITIAILAQSVAPRRGNATAEPRL